MLINPHLAPTGQRGNVGYEGVPEYPRTWGPG